jgi:hypothetical protein
MESTSIAGSRRALNPKWVLAYMGFPPDWLDDDGGSS